MYDAFNGSGGCVPTYVLMLLSGLIVLGNKKLGDLKEMSIVMSTERI